MYSNLDDWEISRIDVYYHKIEIHLQVLTVVGLSRFMAPLGPGEPGIPVGRDLLRLDAVT